MSSDNNWMAVMDKMAADIQRVVSISLREIKTCFDREGQIFDEKFKAYFGHVSKNR